MEVEQVSGGEMDLRATPAPPLVSVVIPAHNAEAFLARTLDSVIAQRFSDFEVLIVDHASTDGTREVAMRYITRDPRLRLIALDHDSGLPATSRNRGLEQALGEFVAFLDADDLWHPRKLEEQITALRTHPEAVLSFSLMRVFGRFGPATRAFGIWPLRSVASELRAALANGQNPIPCSSVVIRRGALQRLGGFSEDPELRAVEDYDLWLRATAIGELLLVPRVLVSYRYHATAVSRDARQEERVQRVLARNGMASRPSEVSPGGGRVRLVGRLLRQALRAGTFIAKEAWERRRHHPIPVVIISGAESRPRRGGGA